MSLIDTKLPALVYDWVRKQPPKVIDHISPSMLGGCMRAHYYAIKHVPMTTPPGPGALLNFELGKMWEEPIKNALEASGLKYLYHRKMFDIELNVEGELDFAICDGIDDEWEVIDSKTESILAEKYRQRAKQTFLEASDRYVIQLGTYMLLLKRQGKKVSRGRFLVITKDNGMIKEYFVPYTQELEDRVMERINTLNKHLKDRTIPKCECGDTNWGVGYCQYGDVDSRTTSSTGKEINTKCCSTKLIKKEKKGK